jgi:hypothetical protein
MSSGHAVKHEPRRHNFPVNVRITWFEYAAISTFLDVVDGRNRALLCHSGPMRWHYRDGGLLWPFVPALAIHVAEEWFAGFTTWVVQLTGRSMPDAAFIGINAVAMALLVLAINAATGDESKGWLAITIATVFLINTVSHVAGSLLTRSYSPGLFSAVVLYVPLGSLTMIRAADQASRATLTRGVITAALIHALVFAVAFAATRYSS